MCDHGFRVVYYYRFFSVFNLLVTEKKRIPPIDVALHFPGGIVQYIFQTHERVSLSSFLVHERTVHE